MAAVRELVVSTLHDVRRLAVELRPAALDDFGLVPALRRLGDTTREATGLDVQVEARLGPDRLSAEVETAVYRIVQEALTNVGSTRRPPCQRRRHPEECARVRGDRGRRSGIRPAVVDGGSGLGLLGMRERVQLLDGTLRRRVESGAGTTLVLDLPA